MKTACRRILKLVVVLAFLGLCLPGLYYTFFLHMVRIPTSSMANTVIPGDHLVIKKRAFGDIKRGDIIVFSWPKDDVVKYIFRVVGLPGETIHVRGKTIYINGQELAEQRVTVIQNYDKKPLEEISSEGSGAYRVSYSSDDETDPDRESGEFGITEPFLIPNDEYFVMGDNRDNASDSRYQGTVPRALIFGKAKMIYWSQSEETGNEQIRWERIFTHVK